jgi:SAM-dependent methyltransferase
MTRLDLKSLKARVKAALPTPALELWWRLRRAATQARFKGLSRQATFSEIYRRNLWGGASGEFCSGSGSTPTHAEVYAEAIRAFITEHAITSVVDLGCGDFEVARRFLSPGLRYVGVDIVPELVARNRRHFGSETVRFEALDILTEPLPERELCLIRQVLQHLSNAEIATALGRLSGFRFAIVTEHLPAPSRIRAKNLDKPHGPDIRVPLGSGVFLDAPPFSVKGAEVLLEVPANPASPEDGEILRTWVTRPRRGG